MTKEEAIKSALKFLVRKQQEQGSWGYADNDNINKMSWDEAIEWIDKQPCGDLISRQAVLGLKTIAPIAPVMNGEAVHYEEVVFVRELEKLSSVEPERKRGKWIKVVNPDTNEWVCGFKCSECDRACVQMSMKYCANCGAPMKEVEE